VDIPEKMKATILYGPDDLRIEEVPVPELKPHEVLIKVVVDAICPTGVSAVKLGKQWGPPNVKIIGMAGHEFSGTVVKVGEGVTNVKVGDRVVADTILRCGKCHYCRTGRDNLCPHKRTLGYLSWAEYIKTVDYQTYKIPENLTYEEAAFTEPVACVLHAFEHANIGPGYDVVIIGAGPMGLMHLQMAKNVGGARVIIADLIDARLEKAKELGADEVINPSKENLEDRVKELTEGRGADTVIVTVGIPEVEAQGVKLAGKGGTVLFFAGVHVHGEPEMILNPNKVHYDEVIVTGAFDKTAEQFKRALKLIGLGKIKVMPLVSHKFPFSKIHEAIETTAQHKGLKVLVYPSKWDKV